MATNYTAEQFKAATGEDARDDDLQRCNCPDAGKKGHQDCGICAKHNKPVFMCSECFCGPRPVELAVDTVGN